MDASTFGKGGRTNPAKRYKAVVRRLDGTSARVYSGPFPNEDSPQHWLDRYGEDYGRIDADGRMFSIRSIEELTPDEAAKVDRLYFNNLRHNMRGLL